MGEASFLGCTGAGDECLPLARDEASALLREREGLRDTFTGTGEEGDVLETEESWLARAGRPFRGPFSGSEVPLELGVLLAVLSGLPGREPGWFRALASLTGELSTESLWST